VLASAVAALAFDGGKALSLGITVRHQFVPLIE
jgi:hypothetical protein